MSAPCAGERRACGAPGVVVRQGRSLCAACDERRRAARNRTKARKSATMADHAHREGRRCAQAERGIWCPVCMPAPAPARMGRPPLSESEDTLPLSLRVTAAHHRILRRLIDAGHGPTLSDAARWAIEQAARGR